MQIVFSLSFIYVGKNSQLIHFLLYHMRRHPTRLRCVYNTASRTLPDEHGFCKNRVSSWILCLIPISESYDNFAWTCRTVSIILPYQDPKCVPGSGSRSEPRSIRKLYFEFAKFKKWVII